MLKWTSVLAFVVACFVGVSAYCAEDAPAKKEKPKFSVEDIFKRIAPDGKLTLEQFKKSRMGERLGDKAEEAFKKMDANGDKVVDLEEFKKDWQKRMADRKPGEGRKPGGRRGGGEKPKN
jgi:hypothetical protein